MLDETAAFEERTACISWYSEKLSVTSGPSKIAKNVVLGLLMKPTTQAYFRKG
jgi:hypothetical protein